MPAESGQKTTSPAPLTHRQVLVVFSGLLLAMLLAALDSTIVATALPTIVGDLGGLERLGWVVTSYLLAQTIVTPLYGKLGDLYGRKVVLQSGILIFLVGSVLCGLSQDMTQLIVFRGIQGIGGGGLMVTTQATVGDIVTPRDRGKYQGIFGAVFGIASIAGPLLGGYFTTAFSWHWIFFINVPLGILAMGVIAATLPKRPERVSHTLDYAGTALLAAALSGLVLFTDLGGVAFPWTSPTMLALAATTVLALIGFAVAEHRAAEPVLPLRLFADATFSLSAAIGLIVGFALFGSVTYIPLFLQVVNGATPTGSGLQMLPLMGGMLLTSITSGQLISRWGRYKVFPIVGTAVMAVGLYLLSRMHAGTTVTEASLYMLVLGAGLGFVMQVLVIAVQNAVDYGDLGVATSGATLFRLIGGSMGTAVFGAIFASGLVAELSRRLPGGDAGLPAGVSLSPAALAALPADVRAVYVEAFTASLGTVFGVAAVIALAGFALTWFVPERRLRKTIAVVADDVGREVEELFPMPTDATSLFRLERSLSLLAGRDTTRRYIERVVDRSGVDVSPLAAWLLVRSEERSHVERLTPMGEAAIDPSRVRAAVHELVDKGLAVSEATATSGGSLEAGPEAALRVNADVDLLRPTEAGLGVLRALVLARRDHLTQMLSEWPRAKRQEMAAAVEGLSRTLVPDVGSRDDG
ncbi:MAG TPA: MDR family MFS transporter [Gemmatimonadaceae bacterium]|nr:MDR family MFS transporter [Gemmatimonadaceae bacterium]